MRCEVVLCLAMSALAKQFGTSFIWGRRLGCAIHVEGKCRAVSMLWCGLRRGWFVWCCTSLCRGGRRKQQPPPPPWAQMQHMHSPLYEFQPRRRKHSHSSANSSREHSRKSASRRSESGRPASKPPKHARTGSRSQRAKQPHFLEDELSDSGSTDNVLDVRVMRASQGHANGGKGQGGGRSRSGQAARSGQDDRDKSAIHPDAGQGSDAGHREGQERRKGPNSPESSRSHSRKVAKPERDEVHTASSKHHHRHHSHGHKKCPSSDGKGRERSRQRGNGHTAGSTTDHWSRSRH
jgi:hypothetical protein